MSRIYTIAILLMLALNTSAQIIINGKTEEYVGAKEHRIIAGVEINLRDASSTISDKKGRFQLEFKTLKVGDKIIVHNINQAIRKAGYEVFNKEAIEQWVISKDRSPLIIVLCKSSRIKELKDKWNAISSASYAQQWKAQQEELKKELEMGKLEIQQYKKKMMELEDWYYQQLENLDNYIDRFARIDLSKMSRQDSAVVRMIEDGNIHEVIQEYEKQNYLNNYLKAKNEIAELNSAVKKIQKLESEKKKESESFQTRLQQQIQAYYMEGGKKNLTKVDSILYTLATKDTLTYNSAYEYASFLRECNEYAKAHSWFKKALSYELPVYTRYHIVQIISHICTDMGDYNEAYSYAKLASDSLAIYIKNDPSKYITDYFSSISTLALIETKRGKYDNAQQLYQYSRSMCESYLASENNTRKDELAKIEIGIINDLAEMYLNSGNYQEAIQAIQPGAEMAEDYHNRIKDAESAEILAFTQRQLGTCYMNISDLAKADSCISISIENFRELCSFDKEKYQYQLAASLTNRGLVRYYNHKGDAAIADLKESLEINKTNSKIGYRNYINEFNLSQSNLGYMLYTLGKYDEAKNYLTQAYSSAKELYNEYPEIFDLTYSLTLINLFATVLAKKEIDECERLLESMTKVSDSVYRKKKDGFALSYSIMKKELAKFFIQKNDTISATREVKIAESLTPDDQEVLQLKKEIEGLSSQL